jgi:hypothetical protein
LAPKQKIARDLLKEEISKPFESWDSILQCGRAPLSILQRRPDDVLQLAYERLHSFPYKEVPECWFRLYTEAAIWKATSLSPEDDWETNFINVLDKAVILAGDPLREPLIRKAFFLLGQDDTISLEVKNGTMITPNAEECFEHRNQDGNHEARWVLLSRTETNVDSKRARGSKEATQESPSKRPKLSDRPDPYFNIPTSFPQPVPPAMNLLHQIPRYRNIDLDVFQCRLDADHEFNNYQGAQPLIVTHAISHWPALSNPKRSWKNPRYWLHTTLGGRRLIPIEIGRAYTDDDWGQKIITFGEFMREHLLRDDQGPGERMAKGPRKRPTGYLAQHDLFFQMPDLRKDIIVPDYCFSSPPNPGDQHPTSNSEEEDENAANGPTTNIWLGPSHTTSPLHTDPHHNILAQVFGHKYIRLYAPSQTGKLYPRSKEGDVDMSNTSSVDVGMGIPSFADHATEEDGEKPIDGEKRERMMKQFEQDFPLFKEAGYVEDILGPGECLFIPKGWWHYVRSLSPSCSVSFWWD